MPFLSADIPGIGGRIKQSVEDFRVDEIGAYEATGEGDHVMVQIRKRGISTFEAIKRLARALDVKDGDIGSAGLKDARAITTQRLSLPPPTTPEMLRALELDDIDVLSATRHPHKLRTGHLRGNAFSIVVRSCDVDENEAAERARSALNVLGQAPGTPNWFGEQRFGQRGDNAERGRELLLGNFRGVKPRPRLLRLYLSAIQSLLFNDTLIRRIEAGEYRSIIDGDILKKTDSGGIFACEDRDADLARFLDGAVVATGPMFGPKMRQPSPGSRAAELEDSVLAARDLKHGAFGRYSKLAPGTRRPLSVALKGVRVKPIEERAIEVSFTLPSGSYATSVLREITKPIDGPSAETSR